MRKTILPTSRRVYVALAILFVILLLILPRSGKFNYDYLKGSPWAYDNLVAQFDFPILKTAEELQSERDAAGDRMIPYYRYSEETMQGVLRSAESLPYGPLAASKPKILTALANIYERGVMVEEGSRTSQDVIFIQRDKRASRTPVSNVYTVAKAKARVYADVAGGHPGANVDSLLTACGLYDLIIPNLVYDKETTALVHAQSADYISPTQGYVNAGQLIVSRGEIVTAEIQQLLDSYKVEYEQSIGYNGNRGWLWLGNALVSLALVVIFFLSVCYTNPEVFSDWHRFIYLIFIFLFATVAALLADRFEPRVLYMVPFALTALYLLAFFRKRVVLPVYVIALLPLQIFVQDGTELFVMFMVAGVVAMLVFDYFNRGWKQFVTAMIVFACLMVTFFGFRLISGTLSGDMWQKVAFLFIGSMLMVAGYPLIYLFEKIFGLVSNSRLEELSDTGNPLLVELSQTAPGTFQHSLSVMNMAEAAARSIDANAALVRAGAMYHDIGKMANPQCFVENETMGNRYHEGLTPQESAREILRHVPDGVAMARKNKLPEIIIDFIRSHHGVSTTGYFYNKFVNEGGDPADKADFTYEGMKPHTREQCIVMLCDSIEAASRTLKDNKPETFDAFVERMVAAKMDDGQLDECEISLKDLETIKSVLKAYLSRLYHDRIVYPKREK